MITLHTIVKNESRFIRPALLSALSSPRVTRALVWDAGSTDDTVSQILSIKDKRIEFQQKRQADRKGLVRLRQEQLGLTETPWFMLVDGDEIWPEKNLERMVLTMKQSDNLTIALVCRSRNVVGDLYHYLPESEGHYQIGQWKGHLNIRAIRNLPGLTLKGEYPNEWYELDGNKIQNFPIRLQFVDTWYLHTTHLIRSQDWFSELSTIDRLKKHKWFYSLRHKPLMTMTREELPRVLLDGKI